MGVHLHPSGFVRAYPSRHVNNVYYDSEDLEALRLSESGISSRTKIRVRWYGDLRQVDRPVLELKIKDGMQGWKPQHPLDRNFDLSTMRWSDLTTEMRRALPPNMLNYISFISRPTLLISYEREYYATHDGRVRATIDHHIKSFDQRLSVEPNWLRPLLSPDLVVVEFKAAVEEEADLREATAAFGSRISRNSKYVRGLLPGYV